MPKGLHGNEFLSLLAHLNSPLFCSNRFVRLDANDKGGAWATVVVEWYLDLLHWASGDSRRLRQIMAEFHGWQCRGVGHSGGKDTPYTYDWKYGGRQAMAFSALARLSEMPDDNKVNYWA
jgi:hypothetical protein